METFGCEGVARVVLTGPESTGKTELAIQLALHYGVGYAPEFVRAYAASKGTPLDVNDVAPVAYGQIAALDELCLQSRIRGDVLLVQDTDLISTVVYCEHYFGSCPASIEAAARARQPALYLLLAIDVPWVSDGIRDRGGQRERMYEAFASTLARLDAPTLRVSGDWATRFDSAVAAIDRLLSA